MTWSEALAWLYSTQQFGIKLGLENTRRLLEAAGHPERACRFLHVAGTNGKGSVCAMLDSMLRAAGHRTGLYTSPHLVDFRERIRVNGEMLPEAAGARILTELRAATRDWAHAPTFFELATVLAIRHFADAKTDFVVLETGMGGRLDSTNAVAPLVSILTPIAMDHAQWLGDTIEEIAAEKAGILKPRIPAVSAPQDAAAAAVLEKRAIEVGAPFRFVSGIVEMPVNLRGRHQQQNAALAISALRIAGISLPEQAIHSGLANVHWPGRFQEIDRIVLDGAHNPHGSAQLVKTWREMFGSERAIVIFGALRDKDSSGMLAALAPVAESFWLVPLESARADAPSHLAEKCPYPHRVFASLAEAVAASRGEALRVLVTGSLFLVGEALEILDAAQA